MYVLVIELDEKISRQIGHDACLMYISCMSYSCTLNQNAAACSVYYSLAIQPQRDALLASDLRVAAYSSLRV
jgi:hypothetical protein